MKKTLALLGIICSTGACQGPAEFPDENDTIPAAVQTVAAPVVPAAPLQQRVEYVDEEGNVLEVRTEPVMQESSSPGKSVIGKLIRSRRFWLRPEISVWNTVTGNSRILKRTLIRRFMPLLPGGR